MNLVIDIGNTMAKTAVMDGESEKYFSSAPQVDLSLLKNLIEENKIGHAIVCNVREENAALKKFLSEKLSLTEMGADLKLPITVHYEPPTSLGKDRLALACGAAFLFAEKNVLVISAGTCITLDFINAKSEYIGGSISPGADMRLKAMHEFTAKLPLAEKSFPKNFIGRNTSQSLVSGAIRGAAAEIDGMIHLYKKFFTQLEVIITGGDADLFAANLENKTFAAPHLLIHALNQIQELNAH